MNADLIATGLSPLHPELAARAAGRFLLSELDRLAKERTSFALESTLSGVTYVERIAELKRKGYRIEMVFLKLNTSKLALKRVAHHVKQGGHNVPEKDVLRRYKRGWPNFVEHYRPLADAWTVYDNSAAQPILLEKHP